MSWGRRIGVIYHSAQLMNDSITSAGVLALILKKTKKERGCAISSAPTMLLFPSHKAADVSFI